ncbi:MAG: sialate O-acetylesterase [Carboxylicivirga sp.]|nr:sialate O-acetylesterase [Carboxylicivirga sp.]
MKNYKILIILFLLSALISPQLWAKETIKAKKKDVHIFILMGQSNMAGYGELLPEDTLTINGAWMLRGWTSQRGNFTWQPAKHPIHNRLGSDQFGLAGPFAKAYLKANPGVEIAFIPVAYGGAEIRSLHKGTDVYRDAVNKAQWAKSHGVIKGVLWHQGESDTVTPEKAEAYGGNLSQLIIDLRNDLEDKNLPFVIGNLAEFYGTGPDHCKPERVKSINKVRNTLRDMPNQLDNVAFVESTGLKAREHHKVHFNRESLILFGERYAVAFEQLIDDKL